MEKNLNFIVELEFWGSILKLLGLWPLERLLLALWGLMSTNLQLAFQLFVWFCRFSSRLKFGVGARAEA